MIDANVFETFRNGHGVVLTEFETARLTSALQGAHALIALLHQREVDAELGADDAPTGLALKPSAAMGLLQALAACTEYASDLMETGGHLGQRAEYGTPAYAELEAAKWRVLAANRKEAGHE